MKHRAPADPRALWLAVTLAVAAAGAMLVNRLGAKEKRSWST
jgi:hypothetical protein